MRQAARLAGIKVSRVKIGMFMISGSIAGLAGVLLAARTTSGNPINDRTWNCRQLLLFIWEAHPPVVVKEQFLAPF
jgi:ABC-type branched-subunit amino acid transport system permease subunit